MFFIQQGQLGAPGAKGDQGEQGRQVKNTIIRKLINICDSCVVSL